MTSIDNRPDVAAFVAEVRSRLADLPADERDELLDGLEADLADQLAEGSAALPDPASYAAELRAAAGLPARRARAWNPPDWSGGELRREFDRLRSSWQGLVARHRLVGQAWSMAVALRPAWWVLRAWVAVSLLDQAVGDYEPLSLMPTFVVPGLGLLVLVVAVVGSVLVGQNRWWPGRHPGRPGLAGAVLLVLLNAFAVVGLLYLVQQSAVEHVHPRYFGGTESSSQVSGPRGVLVNGRAVRNVYPYDAQGQPLTGVQLFDGAGRKISLSPEQAAPGLYGARGRVVGCPWVNGSQRLFNVFPLPERVQRNGVCRAGMDAKLGGGVLPTPPLTQVPPVTLPTPVVAP